MPKVTEQEGKSLFAELRDALVIDKISLDDAWVEHPDLFYRVSEQLTLAIAQRDAKKLDLNNAIAELDEQIRREAGERKITEKAIEQQISMTPRVIDLRDELGRLGGRVDKWLALKESYQQRSYALKALVELYNSNYFTTSTGKAAHRAAADSVADHVREEAGRSRRERPVRER